MKITPKQGVSAIIILIAMITMQSHSIGLWKGMMKDYPFWIVVITSVGIEVVALWFWHKIEFKKALIKSFGFFILAMLTSTTVIATASLKLSEPLTKQKVVVEKASKMIKINETIINSSAKILEGTAKLGDHETTRRMSKEVVDSKDDMEEQYKDLEENDTDSRLEIKSWIQILTQAMFMMASIIAVHTWKNNEIDTNPKPKQESKKDKVKQEPKKEAQITKDLDKEKLAKEVLELINKKQIELGLLNGNRVVEALGRNKNVFTKVGYSAEGKDNGIGLKGLMILKEELNNLKES